MAARSRTSLFRVLHFEYLLKPIPIARSAEMIQTVMSVLVTRPTAVVFPSRNPLRGQSRIRQVITVPACDGDCIV
jgi:hypothetical protein